MGEKNPANPKRVIAALLCKVVVTRIVLKIMIDCIKTAIFTL